MESIALTGSGGGFFFLPPNPHSSDKLALIAPKYRAAPFPSSPRIDSSEDLFAHEASNSRIEGAIRSDSSSLKRTVSAAKLCNLAATIARENSRRNVSFSTASPCAFHKGQSGA